MYEQTEGSGRNRRTGLSPDLILHRASDFTVHIRSESNVEIRYEDETVTCGPHALAILDCFHKPMSFSEALEKLSKSSAGVQDWAALVSTVAVLYRAGVLQDETHDRSDVGHGFGNPIVHVRMLNDRTRTLSFLAGIREVVAEGDVVVDIGTGTGVLAIAAARAGAKHVYAIEASNIARVAEEAFETNGVADRVTLVREWSTRTTLPERADVLVGEIIGDDPLSEDVLQVTMDARKRLLKPKARLVPSNLKAFALPVSIPSRERMKYVLTEDNLRDWRYWYGIDFGPLSQARSDSLPAFYIKPQRARDWKILGEPILLADVNLSEFNFPMALDSKSTVIANTAGQLDGLLMYFELGVGPTTRLTTNPAQVGSDNHWRSPVWVLEHPLALQYGDRLQALCKYRSGNFRIAVTRA